VALAALFFLSPRMPGQVRVGVSDAEQYRVIDTSRLVVTGGSAASTLEAALNTFAVEGWRVRTASGPLVILSR